MKKIFVMCAMAVAAIACQKQEAFAPSELVEVSLTVGVPTKTVMDADGGMFWTNSDDLSVFTDTDEFDQNTNYQFTVQSLSDDAKCAVFASDVTANSERTTFYAIYPYAASRKENALTAKRVEVSYNGGEMSGDFVSTRFIMAGKGAVSGDDFSQVSMQMQQLTWVWDITINNPQAKPIKAVQLSAAESIFPCGGTVDLTADELVVVPNFYRAALQYNFSKVQTGETVLARFPIFPMEAHADVDLDVVVKFEDGTKETFSRKAPAKATEAGKRYHNSYTLGQGVYDDMPEGYVLVKNGDDLRAKLNGQMNSESATAVKLYLESSPTDALTYSLGTTRINPTKSVYIRSNPANVRPKISVSSGGTFDINSECSISCVSLKNVEITTALGSSSTFFYITSNNATLGTLELENCVLNDYKGALFSTTSSKTGIAATNIIVNNCIMHWANSGGSMGFFHIPNNGDKVSNIRLTNSTIEGAIYLLYCNMNASAGVDIDYVISHNTFVNSKGSSDGYTISVGSDYLKGSIEVSSNIFGGSMNQKTYNLLRVGNTKPSEKIITSYSNNFATSDWRDAFTHSGKNGSVDIVTKTGTNDEVFSNLANFDLTLKPGTAAYGANAGDPRWLPTSSAGLGDLEVEDTEY